MRDAAMTEIAASAAQASTSSLLAAVSLKRVLSYLLSKKVYMNVRPEPSRNQDFLLLLKSMAHPVRKQRREMISWRWGAGRLLGARRISCDDAQGGTILFSVRDTAEQKCVETKVGELLARSRALTSIGKAVIATDPKSRSKFMNAAAEKLTGGAHNDASRLPPIHSAQGDRGPCAIESKRTTARKRIEGL
jgi:PAS domain-containing protein